MGVTATSLSIGTANSKPGAGSPSGGKGRGRGAAAGAAAARKANAGASKVSNKSVRSPKSQTDIEEQFRKIINTTILGKGSGPQRISSAISVMPNNEADIQRTKKYLIRSHPLRGEEPTSWKNIPPCVTNAISHSITSIIAGEESLFDWQMKTNERLHKL
jgi:hypothetical protein